MIPHEPKGTRLHDRPGEEYEDGEGGIHVADGGLMKLHHDGDLKAHVDEGNAEGRHDVL